MAIGKILFLRIVFRRQRGNAHGERLTENADIIVYSPARYVERFQRKMDGILAVMDSEKQRARLPRRSYERFVRRKYGNRGVLSVSACRLLSARQMLENTE